MEYKYSVRIISSKQVEDIEGPSSKYNKLENIAFGTIIQEGQKIYVPLPKETYGLNEYNDSTNLNQDLSQDLELGQVIAKYAIAGFAGKKPQTLLIVERTAPDSRFDKFVEDYQAMQNQKE